MEKSVTRLIIRTISVAIFPAFSQDQYVLSKTNVVRLNELAAELHSKYETESSFISQWSQQTGIPLIRESSNGRTIELIRIHECMPEFYTTDNINAAITTSTNEIQYNGSTGYYLSGLGITSGIWDSGVVYASHQSFDNRVTVFEIEGSNPSVHSTHVAGTMIASQLNPSVQGMAWLATLEGRQWCDDSYEMANAALGANMLVSNHSYSTNSGWDLDFEDYIWFGDSNISSEDYNFGFYNDKTRDWDEIAYNAPYFLIVKSASNNRNDLGPSGPDQSHYHYSLPPDSDCPPEPWEWIVTLHEDFHPDDCAPNDYDCIPTYGNAKNIITVGAVQDITPDGYSSPEDVVIMDFSSFGPTDDGRIKPDIVANGDALTSTGIFGNSSVIELSGTSMAAPNVSGTIILLQEHYKDTHGGIPLRADAMKALLLHTADEAGDFIGPDYKYGWGLLNGKKAAMVIAYDEGNIRELTLNNNETYMAQIQGNGSPLKVTLCWTDSPGTPPPVSLDPDTKMLVNDLDLTIERDGQIFFPYVLDPLSPDSAPVTSTDNDRDNVEQVYLSSPAPGIYTVRVNHKNTLENGYQDFALIVTYEEIPDVPGCTDPFATNYYPEANSDDGSCLCGQLGDVNNDGYVDILDVVILVDFTLHKAIYTVCQFEVGNIWQFGNNDVINIMDVNELVNLILTIDEQFNRSLQRSESIVSISIGFQSSLTKGEGEVWTITLNNEETVKALHIEMDIYELEIIGINISPDIDYMSIAHQITGSNFNFIIFSGEGQQIPPGEHNIVDIYLSTNLNKNEYLNNHNISGVFVNGDKELRSLVVNDNGPVNNNLLPTQYVLYPPYPNPFNAVTSVRYDIPQKGSVEISVFDLNGRLITTLLDDLKDSGYYELIWEASGFPSGVYLIQMTTDRIVITQKAVVVK